MGAPMDPGIDVMRLADEEGPLSLILYWILVFLAIFGLAFGSLIYSETKSDAPSNSVPGQEDHHHGPGGEEEPTIRF